MRIQMSTSTVAVYVEMEKLEQAQKLVRQHNLQIDETAYLLPILLEDGAREIRLHELSRYVTEAEMRAELASYGEVISVTETEYGPESKVPGTKTGIRLVKIILGTPTLQIGPTMAPITI